MKMSILICVFLSIYSNKNTLDINKMFFKPIDSNYNMNKNNFYNINNFNNIFKNNTYQKRELSYDENSNDNNMTTTNNNDKERNNQKINKNSGIGWLGVIIIIILSIVVLYVFYVGFRYYKRKKYQNPSFYYKITEEMFEDITPIE